MITSPDRQTERETEYPAKSIELNLKVNLMESRNPSKIQKILQKLIFKFQKSWKSQKSLKNQFLMVQNPLKILQKSKKSSQKSIFNCTKSFENPKNPSEIDFQVPKILKFPLKIIKYLRNPTNPSRILPKTDFQLHKIFRKSRKSFKYQKILQKSWKFPSKILQKSFKVPKIPKSFQTFETTRMLLWNLQKNPQESWRILENRTKLPLDPPYANEVQLTSSDAGVDSLILSVPSCDVATSSTYLLHLKNMQIRLIQVDFWQSGNVAHCFPIFLESSALWEMPKFPPKLGQSSGIVFWKIMKNDLGVEKNPEMLLRITKC